MDHLLGALDSGNCQAAVATASSFYLLSSSSFGATAEPLQRVVDRLLSIGLVDEQARAQIDGAIASLIFRDVLRPHAVACLLDLCTADADVVEMFGETFAALATSRTTFYGSCPNGCCVPIRASRQSEACYRYARRSERQ